MESLRAPELATYLSALESLSSVDKEDFIFVLRPYMWHVHQVAFQDVYDLSVEVFQLLKQNKATLPPAEYKSITTFIKGFVNAGDYDGSGFVVVMGALETAAIVGVIRFYQRYLEQVSVPSLEEQAREYLSAVA